MTLPGHFADELPSLTPDGDELGGDKFPVERPALPTPAPPAGALSGSLPRLEPATDQRMGDRVAVPVVAQV